MNKYGVSIQTSHLMASLDTIEELVSRYAVKHAHERHDGVVEADIAIEHVADLVPTRIELEVALDGLADVRFVEPA